MSCWNPHLLYEFCIYFGIIFNNLRINGHPAIWQLRSSNGYRMDRCLRPCDLKIEVIGKSSLSSPKSIVMLAVYDAV